MRIAIVSPGPFTVPPIKGSSVEHDIDMVSRQFGPNHQVTIYSRTSPKYPRISQEENRSYVRVPYQGRQDYISRVIKRMRKQPPEVILVENRPQHVPALRRAFPHLPIFLNMHSHVYATARLIPPKRMKQVVRMIDGLITNSQYLGQHFIRKHHVPEEKVHAVHLGVDVETYQLRQKGDVKRLRRQLGLMPRHRVLLFAGRLMREKGVHLLLNAFAKVAEQDPLARLVILGGTGYGSNRETPYVKELKKMAKPLGGKVKFASFVPTYEMPLWYQLADVVATPSLWAEPFCRVNLEAMAAGKIVISTPRGGIPEVVRDRVDGYLIPVDRWTQDLPELWQYLWRWSWVRQEMSRRALRRARELTWGATAAQYLRLFAQAAGQELAELEPSGHLPFVVGR